MLSRDAFRGELVRKRRQYVFRKGSLPLCAICIQPITGGGEIHESIITRGMIRDISKADLILVPENSNLVHTECHPKSGRGSEKEFILCATNLLVHEKDRVIEWLERIESELPIIVPQVRREYLNAICLNLAYAQRYAPWTYTLLNEVVNSIKEVKL